MDLHLAGKRALVTGSSSGLGAATAQLLANEGAHVVIHGRDEQRAQEVADAIVADGGSASIALGDLTTDAAADAVAEQALAGGGIDILVNNAGSYKHLSWTAATSESWAETYNVNVISGVRMIQRITPQMRDKGWGRVIQIGGGLAIQPMNTHPQYNATLAARHNLAVSLARELRGTGVTSNIVSPGAILVDAVKDLLIEIAPDRGWGSSWEEIERGATDSLVPNDRNRLGRPDEIAGAVAYLCSPFADYISGATIRIDGGHVKNAH
ncbi:SDR family NAD(P)-dependent oxidoreductase [Nocardioides sp. NPDC059952]|uniref:SDR family NAD(P)-dependent oxidoreductase n=1 Tax=Nocardioides sp. NPDC059952 TaxID=3347014 RepID=UPI00364D02A7